MPHAVITGVGAYLPERRLTNADLERMVNTSDEWIVSRTGIRERRIVAEHESTATMGAEAARAALADAGVDALDVDLIILGSSSPDYLFPATAPVVQDLIGARCAAVDELAACTSFIYGLQHAACAIESGRAKRVLVIGSDALSRIVDWTDRATCVLFGDGAGAVLVEAGEEPGILGIDLGADGSGVDLLGVKAGGAAFPATPERLALREQFIHMAGSEVFKFAVRAMPESTLRALESSGLSIDDVDWIVPHQANQRIMTAAADRLSIEPERVFSNIERVGNTSAASIPLALHELYTGGNLKPGDTLVFVGFGGGLTYGAAVVRWTKGLAR